MSRSGFERTLRFLPTLLLAGLLSGCEFFHPPAVYYEDLALPNTPPPDDVGAMVLIPGGSFMMGAPLPEEVPEQLHIVINERTTRPQHKETLSDFEIGKYEVTAQEFCEFLNTVDRASGRIPKYVYTDSWSTVSYAEGQFSPRQGYELAPATHVQYLGAKQYCLWLSEKTGKTYRLPSEVEWEYAARGSEGRIYPWGNSDPLGKGFYYPHYEAALPSDAPAVTTVGKFPEGATPEGVCDMSGNAYEWCCNYFDQYSGASITANPEKYRTYLAGTLENLHPVMGTPPSPCGAIRSGQYSLRTYVNTAFDRRGATVIGPEPGTVPVEDIGFRILREIE